MVPPVPVPGQPLESDFKRVVSATGTDKFVATQQQFAFPEGRPVPPYIGDASKGVSCPTGHDGDKVFDGRGIRCDRNDGVPRSATATASSVGSGSATTTVPRTGAGTSSPAKPGRPSPKA